MRNTKQAATALAALLLVPLVQAQSSLLVPCVKKCVDQSTDNSCSITDIKCICRESNGRFLPDLVICIHGACDTSLNIKQILDPLASMCAMAGTPVSDTALNNAEAVASSVAAQVTVTQTVTYTAGTPNQGGSSADSTTTGGQPLTVVTVTATAKSTATQTVPATTVYTGVIPVVIVGTDSAGSVYTFTTTEHGAISTITTTNSAGSTGTVVSTYTGAGGAGVGGVIVQTLTTTDSAGSTYTTTQTSTQSPGSSSSGSISSTTTATTSIKAQSTTGSFATSKTGSAPNTDSTNSSPFNFQSAASQNRVGSLLGLAIAFVVFGCWL